MLLRIRVMGKGRRQIEKIGKRQELCKVGIVTTSSSPVACCSDGPRQKCRGRAAAEWPALGSKQVERRASPGTVTVEKILLILCFTLSINLPNWKILIE